MRMITLCQIPRAQVVHELYSRGGAAVPLVEAAFPGSVRDAAVHRPALSALVMGKPEALQRLERIVHPLVQQAKRRFVLNAADASAQLVVLDIPLLFETEAEVQCDAVAVVSAPPAVQRERVLARPGMTPGKLDSILQRQTPDEEKRRRADYVIDTSQSLEDAERQVAEVIAALAGREGQAYRRLLAEPAN